VLRPRIRDDSQDLRVTEIVRCDLRASNLSTLKNDQTSATNSPRLHGYCTPAPKIGVFMPGNAGASSMLIASGAEGRVFESRRGRLRGGEVGGSRSTQSASLVAVAATVAVA
jgi:hypothetical protein